MFNARGLIKMIEILSNNLSINEIKKLCSFMDQLKNINHSVGIDSIKNSNKFKVTLKEV